MMNRQQLRAIQHLPAAQFYTVIGNVVEEEVEKEKAFTFYNLATSMFVALRRRFPEMDGNTLHSIAKDTCDIANGIETPAELAATIKTETGFDVYLPPSEETVLKYIPISKENEDD